MEEDYISNLKNFSKLDFQSKVDVINTGRLTPELKGLLQTTGRNGQKITRSFQTEWYSTPEKTGYVAVLRKTVFTAFPAFCSQLVTISGLPRDIVT